MQKPSILNIQEIFGQVVTKVIQTGLKTTASSKTGLALYLNTIYGNQTHSLAFNTIASEKAEFCF